MSLGERVVWNEVPVDIESVKERNAVVQARTQVAQFLVQYEVWSEDPAHPIPVIDSIIVYLNQHPVFIYDHPRWYEEGYNYYELLDELDRMNKKQEFKTFGEIQWFILNYLKRQNETYQQLIERTKKPYTFKGSISTLHLLKNIKNPETGDMYSVGIDVWIWSGTEWFKLTDGDFQPLNLTEDAEVKRTIFDTMDKLKECKANDYTAEDWADILIANAHDDGTSAESVYVYDTAPGMIAENLPRLFDEVKEICKSRGYDIRAQVDLTKFGTLQVMFKWRDEAVLEQLEFDFMKETPKC